MADTARVTHLLDIPLEVEAVVDACPLRVGELLELSVGSLVVSGHPAGENVEIQAGQTRLGAGELARANGRRVVRMVKFQGKS